MEREQKKGQCLEIILSLELTVVVHFPQTFCHHHHVLFSKGPAKPWPNHLSSEASLDHTSQAVRHFGITPGAIATQSRWETRDKQLSVTALAKTFTWVWRLSGTIVNCSPPGMFVRALREESPVVTDLGYGLNGYLPRIKSTILQPYEQQS